MILKLFPAVSVGAKPASGVDDPACSTVSPGVAALTLLHAELVPNARSLPPVSAFPFSRSVSDPLVALTSRTVALVNARFVIVARITGLNRRPFFAIEFPRCTKLLLTSKSTSRLVVVPGTTTSGCESTILIPDRLALGKVIPGVVEPDSTCPFFNVTLERVGSMIRRKPLYVPAARTSCPMVVATPLCNDNRLNDAFGVAIACHPCAADAPSSRSVSAPASSTSAVRASTRTTNMSTRLTESDRNGASVRRTTTVPALRASSGAVELESEQAIGSAAAPSAAVARTIIRHCFIVHPPAGYCSVDRRRAPARP